MIYIESIKVRPKNERTYPSSQVLETGFSFKCSDVNLFVGNQGCGKSTMLNLIQKSHPDIEIKLMDDVLRNGINSFFFDAEKHNPRVVDPAFYTNSDGSNRGIGYGSALASRLKSHGEVLKYFTVEGLFKVKNAVVLLDEPESGLSITNQLRLISGINTAVSNGCQLFIATHCYPLIEAFDVISLEHNRLMTGKVFIHKIKNGVTEKCEE